MTTNNEKELWNAMAKRFDSLQTPQWETDSFLQIVAQLPIWEQKPPAAMDLGCGAGRFSVALAPRCREVVGTDISNEMIDFANRKKEAAKAGNITFFCEDWAAVDPMERGYAKRFDLIIAHMTPALDSLSALQKMNDCCKGYCAMATHYRRESPLLAQLLDQIGKQEAPRKASHIPEFFTYLYDIGMQPQVTLYDREDTRTMIPEEAVEFYCSEVQRTTAVTPEVETMIQDFVRQQTVNGAVTNPVYSKIAAMTWTVNRI